MRTIALVALVCTAFGVLLGMMLRPEVSLAQNSQAPAPNVERISDTVFVVAGRNGVGVYRVTGESVKLVGTEQTHNH